MQDEQLRAEGLGKGIGLQHGRLTPPLDLERAEIDRLAIRRAVARTEGNISNAAKLLGISRPTLYDLLKQYGMQA